MSFMQVPTWDQDHQKILNAHPVPPRAAQIDLVPEVPVRARIIWETDGEQYYDTTAYAYAGPLILVHIPDARIQVSGVWLAVEDAPKI